MKSLNKTLLKILGMLFLYWSISSLLSIFAMLPQIKETTAGSKFALPFFIGNASYIIFSAIISFLLLLKTEGVMRLLHIEEEVANIDEKSLFSTGCKLVGLYIFLSEIDSFLRTGIIFLETVHYKQKSQFARDMQRFIPKETTLFDVFVTLIPILLSIFLIFRTKDLIKFIKKFDK
jgi:hypothetical protein